MNRSRFHAVLLNVLGVSALTVASLVVPVGVAQAAPTLCEPNAQDVVVTGSAKWTVTHLKAYQLPPGGALSITRTATFEKQLTSSRSVTAGASVSAGFLIAQAEASLEVNLADAGSSTTTDTVSVTQSLEASSRDRYYAAYAGRKQYGGDWTQRTCNSRGTAVSITGTGTWKSYRTTPYEGIALCPASRYATNGLPYKACKLTWG